MTYRMKDRLFLSKVEVTSGVDSVPAPATDAVLVEAPRKSPQMDLQQTDEVSGTLSGKQDIIGGGRQQFNVVAYAKGSGAAGTAPETSPLLRSAGLAETILAAASSGTAQAGAASSITLAVGAPSTDLSGFVIETTGGTGPGQVRVITAYNTTSKLATVTPAWAVIPDATTVYSVRAGVLYTPATASLKTVSNYLYQREPSRGNAILQTLLGAASEMSLEVNTRGLARFTFTMSGLLSDPSEVADPGEGTFDATRPPPLRAAQSYIDDDVICFQSMNLALGNEVEMPDCPGETYGYQPALIVDRPRVTGRVNPKLVTLADRNLWADMTAGTPRKLWLNFGTVAGNRISILIRQFVPTNWEDEEQKKIAHEGVPFQAVGQDSEFHLLFH